MKQVRCFSSAADVLRGPEGFMTSPAFAHLRWTLAGDQRDERMRLFCRKLLKRLDGMQMPFYPATGLMNRPFAQHRYVTGADPWKPMENPFLDGVAIEFAHCILQTLDWRCWCLFAEIGFDVARLAQIPVLWGGFALGVNRPGMFLIHERGAPPPEGWAIDKRTYGSRLQFELPLGV